MDGTLRLHQGSVLVENNGTALISRKTTKLTDVTEMQVLLVRHIVKDLNVRIVPLISFCKLLISTVVWNDEAYPQSKDHNDLCRAAAHADNDTGAINRRLRVQERIA